MGNCCNSNKKYNSENNVSISINSNRKCYLNGEFINGSIYLKGKQGLIITQLLDPLAIATFTCIIIILLLFFVKSKNYYINY